MKVLDGFQDAYNVHLSPPLHAGLRSGRYYGVPAAVINNAALAGDTIYWTPVFVPERTTIVELGCNVVTTGTATLARLGMYRLGAGTLTAVALPTEFSVSTTGAKAATISAPVEPGTYFIAIVLNGSITISTAQVNGTAGPAGIYGGMHGAATPTAAGSADVGLTTSYTYAALPSPTYALSNTVYGGIVIPHLTYRI